jgi:hypothetical protein
MNLRQAKYYCPQCKEIKTFTELEKILTTIGAAVNFWRSLTPINPYFICNECDYADKLEYLEYPERKPRKFNKLLSAKKKWSSLFSTLKKKLDETKK